MPLPVGVFLALGAVSATAGLAGALLAFGASAGIAAAVCFAGALGLGFAALASHRARGYGEIRSALAILCAALGATGTIFVAGSLVVSRSQAPPQIAASLPTFLLPAQSQAGPQPPETSATSPASPLPLPLTPPGILLLLALPPPIP